MIIEAAVETKRGPGRPWSMSRRILALLAEGPLTARSISDILERTPPRCVESASRDRVNYNLFRLLRSELVTHEPIDPRQALGSRMIYSITAAGLAELANRTPLVTH